LREIENNPLRIALFTDADVFAGTERHMLDLARGLRAAGAVPSIACPRVSVLGDRARGEGIDHIPVEKGGFIDWPAINAMRQKLRSGEVDIIHAHNGRTALIAALAVKLERRGSYVLTQHFLIPSRSTRRGLKAAISGAIHRWISRGAGHIIAISDASRRVANLQTATSPPSPTASPRPILRNLPRRQRSAPILVSHTINPSSFAPPAWRRKKTSPRSSPPCPRSSPLRPKRYA
jgi:hypothetical protein